MNNTQTNKTKKISLKWQHRLVYAIIYVCIGLLMVVINHYTENLSFLNASNALFIEPDTFDGDFSSRRLLVESDQIFEYTLDIPGSAYEKLEGDEYKLILNGVQDNAIKVWFNDQLVISEGDMVDGRSMLKGACVYGPIEASKIRNNNVMKIETYAVYRTGISDQIIFTEAAQGERVVKILLFLNEHVLYLGLGFIFMSMFFVLIIYLLNPRGNVVILFLSLATFFISFYFLDFLKMNHLTIDYFTLKKLFLLNLSIGVLFYALAVYSEIRKSYILVLPIAQVFYYLFVMIIAPNMIEFKDYYNYWYIGLAVIIITFLLSTIIHMKKSNRVFIIFMQFTALVIFALISLKLSSDGSYSSLTTPVLFVITVAILPLIITFDLFLEKDLRVIREKELKNVAYNQSMTDDLTRVWNKRYLENRLYELIDNAVVALLDLDNLKAINDTYGHLAGDAVLCTVTETIRNNIRQDDDICRYGGDEFVIIFERCNLEYAVHIVEKIRNLIDKTPILFDGRELGTSVSIGLCEVSEAYIGEEIIQCADMNLYKAKENGKNRTEFA